MASHTFILLPIDKSPQIELTITDEQAEASTEVRGLLTGLTEHARDKTRGAFHLPDGSVVEADVTGHATYP